MAMPQEIKGASFRGSSVPWMYPPLLCDLPTQGIGSSLIQEPLSPVVGSSLCARVPRHPWQGRVWLPCAFSVLIGKLWNFSFIGKDYFPMLGSLGPWNNPSVSDLFCPGMETLEISKAHCSFKHIWEHGPSLGYWGQGQTRGFTPVRL